MLSIRLSTCCKAVFAFPMRFQLTGTRHQIWCQLLAFEERTQCCCNCSKPPRSDLQMQAICTYNLVNDVCLHHDDSSQAPTWSEIREDVSKVVPNCIENIYRTLTIVQIFRSGRRVWRNRGVDDAFCGSNTYVSTDQLYTTLVYQRKIAYGVQSKV